MNSIFKQQFQSVQKEDEGDTDTQQPPKVRLVEGVGVGVRVENQSPLPPKVRLEEGVGVRVENQSPLPLHSTGVQNLSLQNLYELASLLVQRGNDVKFDDNISTQFVQNDGTVDDVRKTSDQQQQQNEVFLGGTSQVLMSCVANLLGEVFDLKQMVVKLLQILGQQLQQSQQQQNPVLFGLGLPQDVEVEVKNRMLMLQMLQNVREQVGEGQRANMEQLQQTIQHHLQSTQCPNNTNLFQSLLIPPQTSFTPPPAPPPVSPPPVSPPPAPIPTPIPQESTPQPQQREWNDFLSHLQRHCAQNAAVQAQSNPSSLTEDRVIIEDVEMKGGESMEPVVVPFQDKQQGDVKVTNSVGDSSNVYQGASFTESGEIQGDESMEEGGQSAHSSKQRANGLNGYHCGKSLTYDLLKNYFDRPLKQAAYDLGVCTTTLKRACRKVGIAAWPARQVRKLNRSLKAASNTKEVWSVVDDYVKQRLKQHGQLKSTDVENLVDECVKQRKDSTLNNKKEYFSGKINNITQQQQFINNNSNANFFCSKNNNSNSNAYQDKKCSSSNAFSGNGIFNFQSNGTNKQINQCSSSFQDQFLQAPQPLITQVKKETDV